MKQKIKYLDFIGAPPKRGRKMRRYHVWNNYFEKYIGVIHWRGGWRQYVFTAGHAVDMNKGCMEEIIKFIKKIMKKWRQSLKDKK